MRIFYDLKELRQNIFLLKKYIFKINLKKMQLGVLMNINQKNVSFLANRSNRWK